MNKPFHSARPLVSLEEYKLALVPGSASLKMLEEELRKETEITESLCIEIPLCHFLAKEEMEPTLYRWIQRICTLQGSFELELNNYGGRPPCSIHLRIQNPAPVNKMTAQLKMVDHFIQSNGCPAAELDFSPALSLVQTAEENSFQLLLRSFASRTYYGHIHIENLLLFKKNRNNGRYMLDYAFSLPPISKY